MAFTILFEDIWPKKCNTTQNASTSCCYLSSLTKETSSVKSLMCTLHVFVHTDGCLRNASSSTVSSYGGLNVCSHNIRLLFPELRSNTILMLSEANFVIGLTFKSVDSEWGRLPCIMREASLISSTHSETTEGSVPKKGGIMLPKCPQTQPHLSSGTQPAGCAAAWTCQPRNHIRQSLVIKL